MPESQIHYKGIVFRIETEPYRCLWLRDDESWVEGIDNAFQFPYEEAIEAAKKFPGSHVSVAEPPTRANIILPLSELESAKEAKRREALEKHQATLRRMKID